MKIENKEVSGGQLAGQWSVIQTCDWAAALIITILSPSALFAYPWTIFCLSHTIPWDTAKHIQNNQAWQEQDYPHWNIQDYPDCNIHDYPNWNIQDYLDWNIHDFHDWNIQDYRDWNIPDYQDKNK